ncbi:uncharacterized protein LOC143228785 [Tachypleus tridentatus]|uniref:uncharacterized protein LOC143228785 n=1 Tax=Tachypleus tridentatus TaxID=6853 RepID=UPI003FD26A22
MADQVRDLASVVIKASSLESTSKFVDFESRREDNRNEKIQSCVSYKYQRDFSDDCKNLKVEKVYPFSQNPSHFMLESKPFYHDLIDTLSGPSEDRKMQKLPPVSTILQPHMAYYSREMYKPFQFDFIQEVPFQENADVSMVCESPFVYCNHQEPQSFISHNLTEHHKTVLKSSPMENSFYDVLPASTSDFGLQKQEAVQASHAFTEMPHSFFKHQGLSTNTHNIKSESGMFFQADSKHSTANDDGILVSPSTNRLLTPLDFGTTTYASISSSISPHAFQSTEVHHCDSHSQRKHVIPSNVSLSTGVALNSLHSVDSVHPCASVDTLAASVLVTATETVPNHSFMKTVDMPSEMPNLHCSRSTASSPPFSKLCEVSKENADIGLKSSESVPVKATRCSILSSIKEEPLNIEVSSHDTISNDNSLHPPAMAQLPSMMTFFRCKNTTESDSELQYLPSFYSVSGCTTLKKQDQFEIPENTGSTLEKLSLKKEISANIRKYGNMFSPPPVSTVSASRHKTLVDSNSRSFIPLNCVKSEVSGPTQKVSTTLPVSKTASISIDKMRPCVSPVSCKISEHDDSKHSEKQCLLCQSGKPCDSRVLRSPVTSTSHLESPVPSVSPSKPFQCNLCGKNLATKNVYQSHMRSHSGDKPFTCELCGHSFSQKTSLTRHMRSHTGERPFPCDICGKCFADKERIKIHMRTHTGEKPFACSVCGKCFSQKSTVKRHMSVHTGEKPFTCKSCGKGFANRGNLNAHSKTHNIT